MDPIIRRLRESRKSDSEYLKKVEDILNNQLFGDELYVRVENLEVVSETPTKITFKVDYQVTISIPYYDEETEREYEETEEEYRTRSLTLDKEDLGESYDALSTEEMRAELVRDGDYTEEEASELKGLELAHAYSQLPKRLGESTPYNGYSIKWINDPQGGKHVEVYDNDKKFQASYKDDEEAKAAIDKGELMKESTSENGWTHWEIPKDHRGPWEQSHYYKDYGSGIMGFIYPPYEATVSALKDMTHYDHVAVLYDNNKAETIDEKSVESMEAAKAWLDHNAEYTLSHMTESEESGKFSVGATFKNANFTWKILDIKGDYTLVYAEKKKWNPYVVAWKLGEDGSWGQGHYFEDEDKARAYLNKKA